MFLIKKSENREFGKKNWVYLGAKFTNFDSKDSFGKDIKFS